MMDDHSNPVDSNVSHAIQNLRERAVANEWSVQRVLDELEHLDWFSADLLDWCRNMRESLIPHLRVALMEAPGRRALNAGILLLQLGDAEGNTAVVAALQSRNVDLTLHALLRLIFAEDPSSKPIPLDKHEVFGALQPLLDTEEERILAEAVEIALKYDLPGAVSAIGERLLHLPARIQDRALFWFGYYGEDRGALDLIEKRLFEAADEPKDDPDDHYWIITSLAKFVRAASPPAQSRAADLLVRYVQHHAETPGNSMTNLLAMAMGAISNTRHPLTEETLERVLNATVDDWRRGTALELLSQVRKGEELDRLRRSLTDPKLRSSAARGIAEVARDSADPLLLDGLFAALDEEERSTRELVEALLQVDQGTARSLLSYASRLDPYDTMRVRWIIDGLTPDDAVTQLVEAEVIEPPSEELQRELRVEWEEDLKAGAIVHRLLGESGRLLWFDAEASMVPPDYVTLLRRFRECGLPTFDASAFWQHTSDQTGESTVQFLLAEQVHTFLARDIGDWYDVEAVMQGINGALEELGVTHRFIQLHTFDQTILLTFGPETSLRRAARALHLPLEDDPEVQAFWVRSFSW
jgi:hypothetical protein